MRPNPFSQTRRSDQINRMSSQKNQAFSLGKKSTTSLPKIQQQFQGTNFLEQKFLWVIKGQVDPSDSTIALTVSIPPLVGQKKKFIQFQSVKTLLLDYPGSDFPGAIYLQCQQLDGFNSSANVATHIVQVAYADVAATVVKGGFNLSNVGYSNSIDSQVWDITSMPSLTLRVGVNTSDEPVPMPIQNPIFIRGKIVRLII